MQFSQIPQPESSDVHRHFSTISGSIIESPRSQNQINLQESNSLTAIQQSNSEEEFSYHQMNCQDKQNQLIDDKQQNNKKLKASAIQANQIDIDKNFISNSDSRFQLPKVSSLASALKKIQLQFQGEFDASENFNSQKRLHGQRRKLENKIDDYRFQNKNATIIKNKKKQKNTEQVELNNSLPDILKSSKKQIEFNQNNEPLSNRKNSQEGRNNELKSRLSIQKQPKYEQYQTRTSSLYKASSQSQTQELKEEDIIQKQQQDNIQFLNQIVQSHKLSVKVNRRNQTKSYDRFKFYQIQSQKQKTNESQGYILSGLENQNQLRLNQSSLQDINQNQKNNKIQQNQSNQSLFSKEPNQIFSVDALARNLIENNKSSLTILQSNLEDNNSKQDYGNIVKRIKFSNNQQSRQSQRSNQDDAIDNETELQSSLMVGHKWDSSLKKSQNDFQIPNTSEQFLLLQNEIGQQSIESASVKDSPIEMQKLVKKEKKQAIKKLKKQQKKFIIQDN